jgi:hypothetical protein
VKQPRRRGSSSCACSIRALRPRRPVPSGAFCDRPVESARGNEYLSAAETPKRSLRRGGARRWEAVLVVQAAEDGGRGHLTGCDCSSRSEPARACGRLGAQAAMRAAVVIAAVLAQGCARRGARLTPGRDRDSRDGVSPPGARKLRSPAALWEAREDTAPRGRGAARGNARRRCCRGRAADSVAVRRQRPRSCVVRPTRPSGAR